MEIYSGSVRLATHNRFPVGRKNQYSIHMEDIPDKFRFSPWDDTRIKNWAHSMGRYTGEAIDRIFESVSIKEQDYNPALAVLRLSNKYSETRLEAACEFAITQGIKKPRYHHLNSILSSNQDEIYLEKKNATAQEESPMGYLRCGPSEHYPSEVYRFGKNIPRLRSWKAGLPESDQDQIHPAPGSSDGIQ